jgi:hypothetical protein
MPGVRSNGGQFKAGEGRGAAVRLRPIELNGDDDLRRDPLEVRKATLASASWPRPVLACA